MRTQSHALSLYHRTGHAEAPNLKEFNPIPSGIAADSVVSYLRNSEILSCEQALATHSDRLLSTVKSPYDFALAVSRDHVARARFAQSVTLEKLKLQALGCESASIRHSLRSHLDFSYDVASVVYYQLNEDDSTLAYDSFLFPTCDVNKIGKRIFLKHVRFAYGDLPSRLSGPLSGKQAILYLGSKVITVDVNGDMYLSLILDLQCRAGRALSAFVPLRQKFAVSEIREMLNDVHVGAGSGKGRSFMVVRFRADKLEVDV